MESLVIIAGTIIGSLLALTPPIAKAAGYLVSAAKKAAISSPTALNERPR